MSADRLALELLADATAHQAIRQIEERRQQQAAETARRQEQSRGEQRRKVRRVVTASLWLLGLSLPVWALTPVVGSFVSIASDNFTKIIFLGSGETGATAGSGPEALYMLLAWLIPITVVSCAGLGLALPYPSSEEVVSRAGVGAFAVGLLITFYQGFSGSGSAASWFWPFVLALLAHGAYGLLCRSRAT